MNLIRSVHSFCQTYLPSKNQFPKSSSLSFPGLTSAARHSLDPIPSHFSISGAHGYSLSPSALSLRTPPLIPYPHFSAHSYHPCLLGCVLHLSLGLFSTLSQYPLRDLISKSLPHSQNLPLTPLGTLSRTFCALVVFSAPTLPQVFSVSPSCFLLSSSLRN